MVGSLAGKLRSWRDGQQQHSARRWHLNDAQLHPHQPEPLIQAGWIHAFILLLHHIGILEHHQVFHSFVFNFGESMQTAAVEKVYLMKCTVSLYLIQQFTVLPGAALNTSTAFLQVQSMWFVMTLIKAAVSQGFRTPTLKKIKCG